LNNLKNIFQAAPALTGITSNFTFPQTAESIEKRLPAPYTTRAGGADQEGHPAKVKVKGRQESRRLMLDL
jgi:hypothetical protein